MKNIASILAVIVLVTSCSNDDNYESTPFDNPEIDFNIPANFPLLNSSFYSNKPTTFGVELGEKLFTEKRFSINNTVSCSSCHVQTSAFADHNTLAVGVEGRIGFRNTPPIQNLAFMNFYNWDGSKLQLENQSLVPIITHEEMDSSILEVIGKIENDPDYEDLFEKAFGDEDVTADRIYNSIAQYEYTLISANSKYDRIQRNEGETYSAHEAEGALIFENKCASCHSTALFTDQSFRNIGFPINPNTEEAGRARVTGDIDDYLSFRVPTLRNIEHTAPYGSFGQFPTLRAVLDYLDNGVVDSDNLDPILKNNNNRIPLTEEEKSNLIAFMTTLSDVEFLGIND